MELLWIHVASTMVLVGLIWTIQVVHYPLMEGVHRGFRDYHQAHCTRITGLVAPLMAIEALTALALFSEPPPGVRATWTALGLALLAVIWATTAFLSVPEHTKLGRGYDRQAIQRLVGRNWIRTLAWSLRGLLVMAMAASTLEFTAASDQRAQLPDQGSEAAYGAEAR